MRKPVQYSDNPKMDKSGITAKQPQYGYQITGKNGIYEHVQVGTKDVTGGELYMEAIKEDEGPNVVTDSASLQKIAGLVGQGYSKDHAVDICAKEVLYTPEGTED